MAFSQLTCAELKNWMNEQPEALTVIDIRDPQSFELGHISGAQHIDNNNVEQFIAATPRDTLLIVCCYHGNSSQGAADYFNQQGFEKTYSLMGGYEEWKIIE